MRSSPNKQSAYWQKAATQIIQRARNALFGYGILMVIGLFVPLISGRYSIFDIDILIHIALMSAVFYAGFWSFRKPVDAFRLGLVALSAQGLLQLLATRAVGLIVVGVVIYFVYNGLKEAREFYEDKDFEREDILDADLD